MSKNLRRDNKNNNFTKLKLNFLESRAETPSFVCCCCERLLFRRSVVKLTNKKISSIDKDLLLAVNNFDSEFICKPCNISIFKNKKVPKLSISNSMNYQPIPEFLKIPTDLE